MLWSTEQRFQGDESNRRSKNIKNIYIYMIIYARETFLILYIKVPSTIIIYIYRYRSRERDRDVDIWIYILKFPALALAL